MSGPRSWASFQPGYLEGIIARVRLRRILAGALVALNICGVGAAAATQTPCAVAGQSRDGVTTTRTTLGGVPAILRIPAQVTKPPIILWHGFGPPASEAA